MAGYLRNQHTTHRISITPEVRAACRFAYTVDVDLTVAREDVAVGDRVLLINQASAVENGIYLAGTDLILRRAPDANRSTTLKPGVMTAILEGPQAGMIYLQTSGVLGEDIVYVVATGDLSELEADQHTHDNKALLDSYTQSEADLTSAVDLKHDHANKGVLDNYDGSANTVAFAGGGGLLSGTVRTALLALGNRSRKESVIVALSDEETPLEAATDVVRVPIPYPIEFRTLKGSLNTASTDGAVVVEVYKNDVLAETLTLPQSDLMASDFMILITCDSDDIISFDITSPGVGATGLKVTLIGEQP